MEHLSHKQQNINEYEYDQAVNNHRSPRKQVNFPDNKYQNKMNQQDPSSHNLKSSNKFRENLENARYFYVKQKF